ncbi:S8 family serine peptidase [Streptomyces sp. NPDC048603]|uniref:S8 family serine peptidase n=1 Tax=Streptomyces sp. NPDC048603 TaxID=3365577 RepID=UPI003713D2E0
MRTTPRAVALAALAVAMAVTGSVPAGAVSGPAPVIPSAPAAQHRAGATGPATTVTLVTGDRVVLGADGTVLRLIRGAGRESVPISVRRTAGHTHVVPRDALRMISEGTLDRRLFDVTQLVADKYDDAHRGSIPLILGYRQAPGPAGSAGSPDPSATGGGPLGTLPGVAQDRRALPAIGGEAFEAAKSGTTALWSALTATGPGAGGTGPGKGPFAAAAPAVSRIWLDAKVYPTLDKSTAQIGVPAAVKAGFTGKGVKVAVLDTGVDQTHPDLKGVEIAEKNFTTWDDARDFYGHGTHVASILAGSGAKSGGKYKGVATGAQIIDAKVLGNDGPGQESWILAGMQWAVDQGAKVVNMSLGAQEEAGDRPMDEAVARLSGKALFVASAGNLGSGPGTISSPGGAPQALTVGNVTKQEALAEDSSRGPSLAGPVKPDLTAPGTDITAARSSHLSGGPGNGYVTNSGTSMAAPHAAGAAAILMQQHPAWTGQQVKQALTASAKPNPVFHAYQQGSGRLDVARAITANVVGEPGSLTFGTQSWPHTDDKPVAKTLTYRNLGSKPVTLALSTRAVDEQGRPAPAGMFTVKDAKLTVPAGGTAKTTVTANTKLGTVDGTFGGTVLASGGGQAVSTGLVVVREIESYDLTLRHIDLKGESAGFYTSAVFDPVTLTRHEAALSADGVFRIRLPKGDYAVESSVFGDGPEVAALVQPVVKLDRATTITLDARKAKPVTVTPPDPAAKLTGYTIGYQALDAMFAGSWNDGAGTDLRTAHLGPSAPDLKAQYSGVWQAPGGAEYRLAYNTRGSWFTGLDRRPGKADLAEVKTGIATSVAKPKGRLTGIPVDPSGFSVGVPDPVRVTLPRTITQYVSAAPDLRWTWIAEQLDAAGEPRIGYVTAPKAHAAGKTHSQWFNTGVVGPDLKADPEQGGQRTGNDMTASVRLFSDGNGHAGDSATTGGETLLERNGTLIASSGAVGWLNASVPAESAAYRLSMYATRSVKDSATSTKVSVAWTFTSARPKGSGPVALPLSTVRLSPHLSSSVTAKAGAGLKVPLELAGAAAAPGALASLTVKVSYDDGRTWVALPVTTDAQGKRSVNPAHPKTAKAASFRVDLKDKAGNTMTETITNAYLLAP